MKKRLKRLTTFLVVTVVAILALPFIIYVPPVQRWLVKEATEIASEQMGMDISIEGVSLSFPLDLSLDGVLVKQENDTIANIGSTVVDVQLLPLFEGRVAVDILEIQQAHINTLSMIPDVQVKGWMGLLQMNPSLINLATGDVNLSEATLADADITVLLSDTAEVDTTETGPTPWRIKFDAINIEHSKVNIHMPGDSMLIGVEAASMLAKDGRINLAKNRYEVGAFKWQQGRLMFDLPFEPYTRNMLHPNLMDYSHMDISSIDVAIDSILYTDTITKLNIAHAALHEVCGLDVTEMKAPVTIDGTGIRMPWLTLRTPYTSITGKADVDFNVADDVNPGHMDIKLDAQMGKQDMAFFYDGIDTQHLPEWPLILEGQIQGNLQQAQFDIDQLTWPTLFEAAGSGMVKNVMDMDHLLAQLQLRAKSYDVKPLLRTFDVPQDAFSIPSGLAINGTASVNGSLYATDLVATLGQARATLTANFDQRQMAYDAKGDISSLNLGQFLPGIGLGILDADFAVKGTGTDFFKPGAWLNADANIRHLVYNRKNMDDIRLQANLKNGHAMADIMACNKIIEGTINLDATLGKEGKRDMLKSTISTQLAHLDLFALDVTEHPLTIGLSGDVEMSSNMDDTHYLSGLMEHIYLRDSLHTYHPEKVGLLLRANPDTTYVRAQSGTLIIKMDVSGGYMPLADQLAALGDSINTQMHKRVINTDVFKELLPVARLYVSSQQGNPMANFLKAAANIDFKDLLINITTSPEKGLNGEAHLLGLNADSTRIDSIFVTLIDKPNHGLTFQGRVANNRRNPQFVFTALIDGLFQEHGMSMGLRFFDRDQRMGLRLGAKVEMEQDGLRFHLLPERPTIGYREFALNKDNFLFLRNDLKLQADVSLLADDGTGVRVYSEEQNSAMLQDLTISLNKFDLDQLTTAIPYVPHITGLLNGDYHLTMNENKQISVASDMEVRNMTYEGCRMGNISTEFVYLQREDETHAVEGTLMQDGKEIAMLSGSYKNKKVTDGHEYLTATLTLTQAPLNLINGFIPDQLIGLEGVAEGEMSIEGSLSSPNVNGEVYLESAYLFSQPYGVRLRFDNDPVRIQQSKLLLENFTMYAYNDNPLNIMGEIDFHDLDNMTMNMRMRAQDFQLINSKQTANSIAFGKAFVNFFASMQGPVDRLKMRGRLDVLGNTDLTYLLLDSPLSTDNQMDELVKFTDFNDTTQTVVQRPQPEGLDMDLRISIDQGAHVKCGLNVDQSNYVELFGGGDLRMKYNNTDGILMTGRYTLTSGQMKYSLPVIPLKTFNIQEGSYVEFTGDVMNPTLNITATEHHTASIGREGEPTRSVAFDCGVAITRTLQDMGLQFIISAPEDYTVNSELNAMSVEQRGKLAVTMLTTGMYMAEGNNSSSLMNNALSAFLESEINNITGNALRSVDLSIGLDNNTDATGQSHTDYSFKFAKRFWNNRMKVQIGGKVSSGNEMQGQKQSFFDNVAMEYRLSPTSNQYVKLFYNQNVYDWLEGYTSEYGGGFIWKRKLDHWWQVFKLKNDTERTMPMNRTLNMRRDSTKTVSNDTIR
ncbi:translocation/assembly module TamB domain-containing protein [Prevotella sp. E15-22]|uniref:translocation/assembly module TamB domain-containing protein n=1 Tax=Prevotella sp. E15-22 TaxID=2937774 RepID=UPI0020556220|nr:translocation/assembly module TamB domain-containing protein [Prevotella sp. E15-22]UPS43975.1 translocation/assembly module TamB domain-containing protein [Prevotella sp. E15-22]